MIQNGGDSLDLRPRLRGFAIEPGALSTGLYSSRPVFRPKPRLQLDNYGKINQLAYPGTRHFVTSLKVIGSRADRAVWYSLLTLETRTG